MHFLPKRQDCEWPVRFVTMLVIQFSAPEVIRKDILKRSSLYVFIVHDSLGIIEHKFTVVADSAAQR